MKKLLFATFLTIITIAVYSVSKKTTFQKSTRVTPTVKEQLSRDFANAKNVYWTVSEDYQKARFSVGGKRITAIYDRQGNYLGAVQYISYDELPEAAKKSLEKDYKGFKYSDGLLVVGRPEGYSLNDIGSYWIGLSKKGESTFVNYSYDKGLALYKTVTPIEIVQN